MAATCPGEGLAIRTRFLSLSPCFSKPRSRLSFHITAHGYAGSQISLHSRARAKMTCSSHGKASGTTLVPEIFTPPRGTYSRSIADVSPSQSSECRSCRASVNILRTRWRPSRSIDPFQLSKPTPLAFWRGSLIFANPSIPPSPVEPFGDMPRVFFQNQRLRPSTPHCSISARLYVSCGSQSVIDARSKHSAAHLIRRRFRSKDPGVGPNDSSKTTR
jgi:hypothetical protein